MLYPAKTKGKISKKKIVLESSSKSSHWSPKCAVTVFRCSLNKNIYSGNYFFCHRVLLVKNSHDQVSAKNHHLLKTKRLPAPHLQSRETSRPRCRTSGRTFLQEHSASSHSSSSLLLFQLPWKHQRQSNTDKSTHSPSSTTAAKHDTFWLILCSLIEQDSWADIQQRWLWVACKKKRRVGGQICSWMCCKAWKNENQKSECMSSKGRGPCWRMRLTWRSMQDGSEQPSWWNRIVFGGQIGEVSQSWLSQLFKVYMAHWQPIEKTLGQYKSSSCCTTSMYNLLKKQVWIMNKRLPLTNINDMKEHNLMQMVNLHRSFDRFSLSNKNNIASKWERDMNKIVDKEELKANKNEMFGRRNAKCETSKHLWQAQLLPEGTFWERCSSSCQELNEKIDTSGKLIVIFSSLSWQKCEDVCFPYVCYCSVGNTHVTSTHLNGGKSKPLPTPPRWWDSPERPQSEQDTSSSAWPVFLLESWSPRQKSQ